LMAVTRGTNPMGSEREVMTVRNSSLQLLAKLLLNSQPIPLIDFLKNMGFKNPFENRS
jgi:hypothetical protein